MRVRKSRRQVSKAAVFFFVVCTPLKLPPLGIMLEEIIYYIYIIMGNSAQGVCYLTINIDAINAVHIVPGTGNLLPLAKGGRDVAQGSGGVLIICCLP